MNFLLGKEFYSYSFIKVSVINFVIIFYGLLGISPLGLMECLLELPLSSFHTLDLIQLLVQLKRYF